ncbi:MAG: DUF1003 domain-containing protein [Actinomycetota bacterium]
MPEQSMTHRVFGEDKFGEAAERAARFFGTPRYIIGQSIVVIAWIIVNSIAFAFRWDPYPFILLNLAFSTQAAYAAPLILLAQTRQADRDKIQMQIDEELHTRQAERADANVSAIKAETDSLRELLQSNTDLTSQDKALTEQVAALTKEIRQILTERS